MNTAQAKEQAGAPCRTALVLGMGSSGAAAARLLRGEGWRVVALERQDRPRIEAAARALEELGVEVLSGDPAVPDLEAAFAVVSPGVPWDAPWMQALRARGVPLCSDIELGWSRFRGRTVAVTGSNGKSTAVKWLGDVLGATGLKVAVGGNYGPPVCGLAMGQGDADLWVLEVSSFQLETVDRFRPDVGVLLNVQPNHLDRHGDMETYFRLKSRLFARGTPAQTAVIPLGEARRIRRAVEATPRWLTFGEEAEADYRWVDGRVHGPGIEALDLRGTYFDNPVLGPVCAAVTAAATAIDAAAARHVAATAAAFIPLPHRMEETGRLDGVRFVDNSKATSLPALEASLRMAGAGIRLIAGGRAKSGGFETLDGLLRAQVRGAYLIGEAADTLRRAWEGVVPCRMSGTLEAAVHDAWGEACPGETILLAPGCASFDQFPGFEARGECFKKAYYMLAPRGRL